MLNIKLWSHYKRLREELYKKFSKFHLVDFPEGPKVLVLSPHPDDDVFGCGGALLRHVEMGHHIQIVYLCKGEKGVAGMNAAEATSLRKKEATEGARILGINQDSLIFLNNPDNELSANQKNVAILKEIICDFSPNLIYLPSFLDNHTDHINTNKILQLVKPKNFDICAYEVWTPLIPNRLIDISSNMEVKIQAMKAHQSQLKELNYLDGIIGLNQYRGCLYPKRKIKFAEAFVFANGEEYFKLMGDGV